MIAANIFIAISLYIAPVWGDLEQLSPLRVENERGLPGAR
jgi:hypothetical protein